MSESRSSSSPFSSCSPFSGSLMSSSSQGGGGGGGGGGIRGVRSSAPIMTNWNGLMAELFDIDTAYTMNEQDSSSGIASDDHTQHSSPTFSTFKDHPKNGIGAQHNPTKLASNGLNSSSVQAANSNSQTTAGGRRKQRITYLETELDDLASAPRYVVASAVEEDTTNDEDVGSSCSETNGVMATGGGRVSALVNGRSGKKTPYRICFSGSDSTTSSSCCNTLQNHQQQHHQGHHHRHHRQQYSDYASDNSDTLRTSSHGVSAAAAGGGLMCKGASSVGVVGVGCNQKSSVLSSCNGAASVSICNSVTTCNGGGASPYYKNLSSNHTSNGIQKQQCTNVTSCNNSGLQQCNNPACACMNHNEYCNDLNHHETDQSQLQSSYFDFLPDHVMTRIFMNISSSEQLARLSRVCRRWYHLVWSFEPLWTNIHINSSTVDADRAVRSLTKKLSYAAPHKPKVCIVLDSLNLNGCHKLTDRGLLTVAKRCPELRILKVQNCVNITNIALFEIVSRCVNLEHLNVAGCPSISCLSLTPEAALQAQTYSGMTMGPGGINPVPRCGGLDLTWLDMTDCPLLDASGLQLVAAHCPRLQHLYLRRCQNVTDPGIQYVATYCTQLQELSIGECAQITDFGAKELARLGSGLRYLSASKCVGVSDFAVVHIAAHCRRLRYLNLRGCDAVSDSSLEALGQHCSRLKSLDVGKCDITDDGLTALAIGCQHLRRLSLKGCVGITDRGLASLVYHLPHLNQLNIQQCHLTVEGYREVKRNCKNCVIEHNNPGFF